MDLQLRVTFPFNTGSPDTEQMGGDGGADEDRRDKRVTIGQERERDFSKIIKKQGRL